VRGRTAPMDLVCVELAAGTTYSFLSAGWGFISDVDIESEKLRWMGDTRFSLWSSYRLANLRLYRGRLSYLQAEGYQPTGSTTKRKGAFLRRSTSVQALHEQREAKEEVWRRRFHSTGESALPSPEEEASTTTTFPNVEEGESGEDSSSCSSGHTSPHLSYCQEERTQVHTPELGLPPLDAPVPDSWTTIEDDFVLIYAVHQSYIADRILLSPWSKLHDGVMFLFTIRRGSFPNRRIQKSTIAQFLLKMESGEHIFLPGVEMIPVRAFRITPLEERGTMTVDGELVERGVMQAAVLPAMVRVVA